MPLTDIELKIVGTIVQRFFNLKESTPRKLLVRKFRTSQAFYQLTSRRILTVAVTNVATENEAYLPLSLAFHYYNDTDILRLVRRSLSAVLRILQGLFDVEIDKTQFTVADVEAHARKIFDLPPTDDEMKLGLYVARDLGVISATMTSNQIDVVSFQIVEQIVEVHDIEKAWDDFITRSTVYENYEQKSNMSALDLAAMLTGNVPAATQKARLIDAVTGILQRGELDADLERLTTTPTDENSPVSFVMIDLDHFKILNDNYGHPAGDEVLRAVAQTIAKAMRGRGIVYRYGGEEISIILPNHSLGEATATAERIRDEITTIRLPCVEEHTVTASLGVATIPDTTKSITNLVKDADRALYEAKESGRDRVCCAVNEDTAKITQHKSAKYVTAAPSKTTANRDWPGDWKLAEDGFRRYDKSYARADWSRDSSGPIETWTITGDTREVVRDVQALCLQAGRLLVVSPTSSNLSEELLSHEDDIDRWLYFLKGRYGLDDMMNGTSTTGEKNYVVIGGSIRNLALVSARACIECGSRCFNNC